MFKTQLGQLCNQPSWNILGRNDKERVVTSLADTEKVLYLSVPLNLKTSTGLSSLSFPWLFSNIGLLWEKQINSLPP